MRIPGCSMHHNEALSRLTEGSSRWRSPAPLVGIWLSERANGEPTVEPVAVSRLPGCWPGRTVQAATSRGSSRANTGGPTGSRSRSTRRLTLRKPSTRPAWSRPAPAGLGEPKSSGAMSRSCLGRDCLDEHDGDVRAYQSAQRASAPSLVIGQMTGALAVGGSGSTNTANYSGLDVAQVRALAEMLVQARGTLGLVDEQLAELGTHVEARARRQGRRPHATGAHVGRRSG